MKFIKIKKAAMFGLDARIALAIFGALSVISGAALYSAIQEAKVVSIITNVNELEKALISYYLDTGSYPEYDTDDEAIMHAEELIKNTNSVKGWNGPYTSLKILSNFAIMFPKSEFAAYIRLGDIISKNSVTRTSCTALSDNSCGLWLEWYGIPKNIAESIDKKVDGVDDIQNGKIRYCSGCSANGSIFYKLNIN